MVKLRFGKQFVQGVRDAPPRVSKPVEKLAMLLFRAAAPLVHHNNDEGIRALLQAEVSPPIYRCVALAAFQERDSVKVLLGCDLEQD